MIIYSSLLYHFPRKNSRTVQSSHQQVLLFILNNDVGYSHLPPNMYLSIGLPRPEILERWRNLEWKYNKNLNDYGLEESAKLGCRQSLVFFKSIGATRLNCAFEKAADGGHMEILKILNEWGAIDINCIAIGRAARNGHIEIVKQLRAWGATSVRACNRAMSGAASGGHMNIVKLVKQWIDIFDPKFDMKWMYLVAAEGGHYDIIKMFIEWDDRYVNTGMKYAALKGHTDIVRLCRQHGASNWKKTIEGAARYGHTEIIKLYKEWGLDTYFEDALKAAADFGHIEVMKLCKEYGAVEFGRAYRALLISDHHESIEVRELLEEWMKTNIDYIMIDAADRDDIELLRECKAKGAVEYNKAMKYAARSGHIAILKLLHSWGADDFDSAIRKAMNGEQFEVLRLFNEWNVLDIDKAMEISVNRDVILFLSELKSS